MRRTVRCFAASAIVASLTSAAALAAPPAELDWRAPSECPSRDNVLAEVSRLVATAPAEPLVARARVTRAKGDRFEVVIEIKGSAHGVRTLRAHSCESLARATALIIALAIDPQAAAVVSEQAESSLEPEPQVPDQTEPEPPEPVRTTPGPEVLPLVFLGFFAERALVPELALGAEAGAGLRWRFARADLAAGVIPRASATLPDAPHVSGEFTLAFVALRACAGAVERSIAMSACATLRGATIWARGEGASPSLDQTARSLSVEPGMLMRVPGKSGIGGELTANLVLPLIRPRFVIEDGAFQRELFHAAAVGAIVKLGLSYEF
jgi:hypothetical protein